MRVFSQRPLALRASTTRPVIVSCEGGSREGGWPQGVHAATTPSHSSPHHVVDLGGVEPPLLVVDE